MKVPLNRPSCPSRLAVLGVALLPVWALCAPAAAGPAALPSGFVDEAMSGGLDEPVGLAEVPPAGSSRPTRMLFVEQRTARVGLIVRGLTYTAGTVPGVESVDEERGLLGIAVDPGWPARPYLYVHSTDHRAGNHVSISRFTATGDLDYSEHGVFQFDTLSRYDLLPTLPDNAAVHNGGTLRFGPDGMLYVSLGDDGTGCPAQDSSQLVGKILRLDVRHLPDGPGGPPPLALLTPPDPFYGAEADSNALLVCTLGLRNPFRFNVDPLSGDLFIADVGENTWEEFDHAKGCGLDMGWPIREGPDPYGSCDPPPATPLTEPIAAYDHGEGTVIIGGPLYRLPIAGATRFPNDYEGNCFFFDYYVGFVRRLEPGGGGWIPAPPAPGQPSDTDWARGFSLVADLIETTDGSLWYCRQSDSFAPSSGEIRRIRYQGTVGVEAESPDGAGGPWLATPRPNPSRGHVTLEWRQPRRAPVRLEIYDVSGRRVRKLGDERVLGPGTHALAWDGRDDAGQPVRSGHYFARLVVGDAALEGRIHLIR